MASEILKVARQERNALLKELEINPTFQKLQQMNQVIALYEADEGKPAINPPPSKMVPAYQQPREGTKLAQVETIVLEYMRSTGRRYSSGQLLPILSGRGLDMGKVPGKTLASMLSNSSLLNNIKGFGYGPVEWGENLGPALEMKDLIDDESTRSPQVTDEVSNTSSNTD